MAMDLEKLRKLLALDPADPLSRFAIGKKLFETATDQAMLEEAVEHLQFANAAAPEHLATYHILAQALIRLQRNSEAREVLQAGIPRVARVGEGMGRDLGPAMEAMLRDLDLQRPGTADRDF
jgi:predicted Zn-dependent protease